MEGKETTSLRPPRQRTERPNDTHARIESQQAPTKPWSCSPHTPASCPHTQKGTTCLRASDPGSSLRAFLLSFPAHHTTQLNQIRHGPNPTHPHPHQSTQPNKQTASQKAMRVLLLAAAVLAGSSTLTHAFLAPAAPIKRYVQPPTHPHPDPTHPSQTTTTQHQPRLHARRGEEEAILLLLPLQIPTRLGHPRGWLLLLLLLPSPSPRPRGRGHYPFCPSSCGR